MKKFMIWTILVALFGLAGTTGATSNKPFFRVTTSPDEIDFGTAIFMDGVHEAPGALKVEVEANCWHGPILISTTPLKRRGGGRIDPEDIFVRTAKIGRYVSLKRPVVILPTSVGSEKVVLDFKVHAGLDKPAGHYNGMITLTMMPPV